MSLLNNGRFCDHTSQRKPGAPEHQCHRQAYHTIHGLSGGELDYCNKHIRHGLKEYPQIFMDTSKTQIKGETQDAGIHVDQRRLK